jgi:endonuclease/exonuclease/phosphatase family metal-dependent hydrolase
VFLILRAPTSKVVCVWLRRHSKIFRLRHFLPAIFHERAILMELFSRTALRNVRAAVLLTLWCLALSVTGSTTYAQTSDIVLYAHETFAKSGNWRTEPDSTAAGDNRIRYPDSGLAKIGTPLANPTHYFDLTFNAEKGIPYRLWMRAKADANSTNNDSAWVQFSGSVDAFGTPVYRIGTTSATMYNLEECTGCGLGAWGWNDNLFQGFGPLIYFAATGPQTVRVQLREDGLSIDQVVLSPVTYLNFGPGWTKNDSVILAKNSGTVSTSNVILWAADIPTTSIRGSWFRSADASAAGQIALTYPDFGGPRLTTALATPTHYFDVTFSAQAGVPYRLWMRAKAIGNSTNNDSVWVQFSSSLNQSGAPDYRIGTTSAIMHNMEECTGCGLSNWGWNDSGINGLGPLVSFATTGQQTLRVQLREDGINIDQIVLSPQTYLSNSPGAFKNDTVILPREGAVAAPAPSPTPLPNQTPQVSVSASTTSGYNPLNVGFTSNATDADGSIVAYNWNFGDGQTSTQAAPAHVYQSTGSFSARLTVTDNAGATASAAVTINVSSPPPASARFKVLQWNVAYGRGTDNIVDLNRQATWMANMQVDLISLNEVPPANIQTYVDLLRQKTGVTWYSHWVAIKPGDGVGQQILSRYPFVSTGALYLSFSRSVTKVTVSIGGRTVNLFSTHLSPESASWRTTQLTEMNSWMAGFPEQRIVAGDYNLSPNWVEYTTMTALYYDSWQQAFNAGTAFSYPDNPEGRTRKGRIDYINYSKGASGLRLVEVRMPDQRDLNNKNVVVTVGNSNDWGVRPSDHNFFVTTFELR